MEEPRVHGVGWPPAELPGELAEVAIDRSRHHRICTLLINTTTPQKPAIGLYHKLGFREAARTFIDRYELVWLRLEM